VEFDVRDSHLGITVHALEAGKFPIQGGRVATAQGYPLNSIIYLADPNDLIYPWSGTDAAQPGAGPEAYFSQCASKLTRYADDFLRGNFDRSAMVPAATQAILERSLRKT